MLERLKKLTLKGQVMLFTSAIVLISITALSLYVAYYQTHQIRASLSEKVEISAGHLANMEIVIDTLNSGQPNEELLALTDFLYDQHDFLYIVVMDNNRIRFTHRTHSLIGEPFMGDDTDRVFNGESYTSENVGTLGPSLRAFHPVYNDTGNQIGAVAVGISTQEITAAIRSNLLILFSVASMSLLIGLLGAYSLSNRIKKTLNGLEPKEIALAVEERNSMLAAVDSGILAINREGQLILVNDFAKQFIERTGYQGIFHQAALDEIWPELYKDKPLQTNEAFYNQLIKRADVDTVVTKVPLYVKDTYAGALITFNERSHLNDVLRQLIGAEEYARSLRSETHEFMNKLHIIQAMVETDSYDELQQYVEDLSIRYQLKTATAVNQVERMVQDVSIAHFLTKKITWMERMGVEVHLQSSTPWPIIEQTELLDTAVTIIGNTFDNAWEAMQDNEEKKLTVTMKQVGGVLRYVLEDNGRGFSEDLERDEVKSSKTGDHGYGLENIRSQLKKLNGSLHILSKKEKGAIITVHIPYQERSNIHDSSSYD